MKKTFVILTALIASFTLFSCATVKEIPEDKTPAQILQLGHNASAMGSYKGAELCFKTAIERFGATDPTVYVEATFELGHIYLKQKKYDEALGCFNAVLDMFEEIPYGLDPSIKKLCQIDLAKIPDNIKNSTNAQ